MALFECSADSPQFDTEFVETPAKWADLRTAPDGMAFAIRVALRPPPGPRAHLADAWYNQTFAAFGGVERRVDMADDILVRVVNELRQVVDGIQPDQMSAPTPCTEWDVRGVLNHVTGGSIMFAECVENGSISDEEFGRLTSTDLVGDQPSAVFGAAADRALAAFGQPGALERMVTLPFGTMPAGVAANIAVFDLTVHALDLARRDGAEHRARSGRAPSRLGGRPGHAQPGAPGRRKVRGGPAMRRRRAARRPAHGVRRSLDLIDAARPLTQPAGLEPVGAAAVSSSGFGRVRRLEAGCAAHVRS